MGSPSQMGGADLVEEGDEAEEEELLEWKVLC